MTSVFSYEVVGDVLPTFFDDKGVLSDGTLSLESDVDVEVNEYLDDLFTEKSSGIFTINGHVKRLRLKQSLSQYTWDRLQITCRNIAATKGDIGMGVLFSRIEMSYCVEEAFLKLCPFWNIAFYSLLKNFINNYRIDVDAWTSVLEKLLALTQDGNEFDRRQIKRCARFIVHGKNLRLEAPYNVTNSFYDSLLKFGLLRGHSRNTGGLAKFVFPSTGCVSVARKKIFFLLKEEQRFEFCISQIFGSRDGLRKSFIADINCMWKSDSTMGEYPVDEDLVA